MKGDGVWGDQIMYRGGEGARWLGWWEMVGEMCIGVEQGKEGQGHITFNWRIQCSYHRLQAMKVLFLQFACVTLEEALGMGGGVK